MKSRFYIGCILVIFVTIISCTDGKQTSNKITKTTIEGKLIRAIEFGDNWPFSIPECIIQCDNNAVTISYNEKIYPLNGIAKSLKSIMLADLNDIWLMDEKQIQLLMNAGFSKEEAEKSHPKKNIGPILDLGLSMCK